MSSFEIIFGSETSSSIVQADAYEQEGPMTTFFTSDAGHTRLDSWSTRLASFRSADVAAIRRLDGLGPDNVGAASRELRLVMGAEPA